jgi:hypothetical protein
MGRILLRLLSKRGRFPKDDIFGSSHALCSSARIPWSAVSQRVVPTGEEFSEIAVFSPEEVQLYGALALALPDPHINGQIGVEPLSHSVTIEVATPRLDLRSKAVRRLLLSEASQFAETFHEYRVDKLYADYERTDYELAEPTLELVRTINIRDRLLIRGLSKFLTARALSHEFWFLEEAGLAAFISLEAALSIIRQHLELQYARPASFHEAYEYIRATFPTGSFLADWLLELYDLRIIAMHPSSRFGEFWSPPMDADHCLEAIQWLVPIYRHILLGEFPREDPT